MKAFTALVATLFIGFGTEPAAGEPPTFHGIKLGISLDSQLKNCPWNPPKEGDIPDYVYSPYQDEKGNIIPCFHYWGWFTPANFLRKEIVELFEYPRRLKDDKGHSLPVPPGLTRYVEVLVPASTQLGEGTIEGVMLSYLPEELEQITEALTAKFGPSHPLDRKNANVSELFGVKRSEVWRTPWGEVFLALTDREVSVTARTSKLINFEQANKKNEF